MSIGANIRRLRQEKKIAIERMAELLGVSRQTVYRYENDMIATIPRDKLDRMAELLAVPVAALYGFGTAESRDSFPSVRRKRVPLLGEIACGTPIYAEEEYGSYASVGEETDADFCLRARGDSMIGARIYDGDLVFVRAQDTVENGEIGVVVIRDEATLKRVYYYPEKQKLILTPENAAYEPLVFLGEELDGIKILGKAVAFQSVLR